MTIRSINVTVVEQEKYEKGPFCFNGPLDQVIDSLVAIRDSIPQEHRSGTLVEFGTNRDDTIKIEVSYSRPMTQAEIKARKGLEEGLAERQRQSELADLARLKAKYEAS